MAERGCEQSSSKKFGGRFMSITIKKPQIPSILHYVVMNLKSINMLDNIWPEIHERFNSQEDSSKFDVGIWVTNYVETDGNKFYNTMQDSKKIGPWVGNAKRLKFVIENEIHGAQLLWILYTKKLAVWYFWYWTVLEKLLEPILIESKPLFKLEDWGY